MKELLTNITSNGLHLEIKTNKAIYYFYFIINIILISVCFIVIFSVNNYYLKILLFIASIIILFKSFTYLRKSNFRIVFDTKYNICITDNKKEIKIKKIKFILIDYDKSKIDINECSLKLVLNDDEILIHKTDASNSKNIRMVGEEISNFINKPLEEKGKPWIIGMI